MNLDLERPLIVFDIESTGINPRQDRIIDLALIKLHPDGRRETKCIRVNPEIPIPPAATAIHQISNEDVADAPPFRKVAPQLRDWLDGCDLAGFNVIRFDLPLLIEEFARAGMAFDADVCRVIDAQRIFHRKEPRDLTAALAFYCGRMHLGAHGAAADAEATAAVIEAQLEKYRDLPRSVEALDAFCNPPRDPAWADRAGKLRWEGADLVINFGQSNLGQKLKDLARANPKFLRWILTSDFPSDTKRLVADALEGRHPAPPAAAGGSLDPG